MSNKTVESILVVQTAFLGDLLLSVPLLIRLQNLFPQTQIHVLCRSGLGGFLSASGLNLKVIEVDKKNSTSRAKALNELKKTTYTHIFSPHSSFRSGRWVSQLKAQKKIGFKRWWSPFFFSETVHRPMDLPDALRQLSLLENLDPKTKAAISEYRAAQAHLSPTQGSSLTPIPEIAKMELPAFRDLRAQWINERLGKKSGETRSNLIKTLKLALPALSLEPHKKWILLAPGSVWATKRWRPEGFIEVGENWAKEGAQVLVLGAENESDLAKAVAEKIPGAISLAGNLGISDSIRVMALSDILICNDSGAMHMASIVGLPTVAIFGPTTLDLGYRPWQNQARVVQVDLSCRPCGKHGHAACPLGTHECMQKVTAPMVVALTKQHSGSQF